MLIPGSKRVIVSDSGHLVQLEQPRRIADLISDFVRSAPRVQRHEMMIGPTHERAHSQP